MIKNCKKLIFLIILIVLNIIGIFSNDNIYEFAQKHDLKMETIDKIKKEIKEHSNYLKINNLSILIDKKHSLSKNYVPNNLKKIPVRYTINKKEVYILEFVYKSLINMIRNAKRDGIKLKVLSGYRSYSYQRNLYNYMLKKHNKAFVNRYVAKPGHSQHQLGTVIDFNSLTINYKSKSIFNWLKNNAYKYGFSLSYPKESKLTDYNYEPWHYRYFGKEIADLIKKYFNGNQKLFLILVNNYIEF